MTDKNPQSDVMKFAVVFLRRKKKNSSHSVTQLAIVRSKDRKHAQDDVEKYVLQSNELTLVLLITAFVHSRTDYSSSSLQRRLLLEQDAPRSLLFVSVRFKRRIDLDFIRARCNEEATVSPFRAINPSLEAKAARAIWWLGRSTRIGAGPLVLQHYAQFTGRRLQKRNCSCLDSIKRRCNRSIQFVPLHLELLKIHQASAQAHLIKTQIYPIDPISPICLYSGLLLASSSFSSPSRRGGGS